MSRSYHAARQIAATADAVVLWADGPAALPELLPAALHDAVARRLQRQSVVAVPGAGHCRAALLVVAVRPAAAPRAVLRRAGAIGRILAEEGARRAAVLAGDVPLELLVAGIDQGVYRFARYKPSLTSALQRVDVVGASAAPLADAVAAAEAVAWCRDLVNTPTEDMGPDQVVRAARAMARGTAVQVRVHDEAACRKMRMGCLLAVGRTSPRRPRLLELSLPGRGGMTALCGKGVCFDTGGLNLKPGKSMELMRKDMGGAATVLAVMRILAGQSRRGAVRAYLPLVENDIGGGAFRPGDVLTASDGTTIEIGNTDAEGRLILADAITLARRQGAARIVTVATLTGAALAALGRSYVPLMSNDDALASELLAAAERCGEGLWRLPLDEDYRQIMHGGISDLRNDGNGEAGAITAAAFCEHFAGEVPYAHCDISPASWLPSARPWSAAGATGVLVRSLARWLQSA